MKSKILLVGFALGTAALVYACTLRDVTGVRVDIVTVQPSSATLMEGEIRSFSAQGKDGLGNTLPGGAMTWSSSDPSVVSVEADGTAEALSTGQATIWATLEGTRGSATITVEAGPSILLDLESVRFFGSVDGQAPAPITLQITNGGGGIVSGISAAVEYPPEGTAGWLSVALAGTNAPTTLTLSILIGLLDTGTHDATLILKSQDARNSPVRIPVQVTVTIDQPVIGVSPTALEFQGEAGGDPAEARILQVSNLGGGTLADLDAQALYTGVGGWLTVSMSGGTAPAQILVQPDPGSLSPGNYTGEVRVTSPGVINSPLSVGVTLEVAQALGADVGVTKTGPASASMGASAEYVLTVTNSGPGTARDVVLVDSLPQGMTFESASEGGTYSGGVVRWNLGNIPAGTTVVDSVRVAAQSVSQQTNVVRVSTSSVDPLSGNDRATLTTSVTGPDLAVTKNAPASAAAGDQITYAVTVENLGPGSAENVVVRDTLPAGVSFVSATGGGTLVGSVAPNGMVRWDLGVLEVADGPQTFQIVVDILPGASGTLSNSATITPVSGDPTPSNNRSVANTGLGASADLAVTKTAPATGVPGSQITYTVTAQNGGPSNAVGVVLTDTLPSGVTFASATGGGTHDAAAGSNGVVTWALGTLPVSGTPASYEVVVDIDPATTGAVTNIVAITSTTPEADAGNNRSTSTTTVSGSDLAVGKTGPATADPGQRITYTVTVENTGPSDATGVVVTDTLPPEVAFFAAPGGGTHDGSATGGVVTWNVGDLTVAAGQQSFDVTVDIGAATVGVINNVAAVASTSTDPDPSDDWVQASTSVEAADLSLVKRAPATAASGAVFTDTIIVQNLGPSDATGVVVTDTLPPGAAFASASQGGTHDGSPSGGLVTWNLGDLSVAGGALELTVSMATDPGASGTVRNPAAVTADRVDPVAGNNHDEATTTLTASSDIAVTKSGPGAALPGAQITYVVTVQNLGPSDATGVVVTDLLPAGVTFVSATDGGHYNAVGDSVTWNVGNLPAVGEGTQTFDLVVDIDAGTSGGITNTVYATSATADPDSDNNQRTLPTSVSGADIAVSKAGPPTSSPGDRITYSLSVQNTGPSAAGGVVLTDTLPPGVTFVSATGGGHYNASGDTVTWNLGTLTVGDGTQNFDVTVEIDSGTSGAITNAVGVASTTDDPDPSDDGASATTTVTSADLTVAKAAGGAALPGSQLTYTLTVSNAGPTDAVDVVVTDTLPTGVTYVSSDPNGTHDGGAGPNGVVTWNPGTFSFGTGPLTYDVVVAIPASATGTLNNIAGVRSTGPNPTHDPATGNNRSSITTTLQPSADLIAGASAPATATEGDQISFGATVQNDGPSDAVGTRVIMTLPAGVTFVSATGGMTPVDGVLTWDVGTLTTAAGQQVYSAVVDVDIGTAGTITQTVEVTSTTGDPNALNDSESASTGVAASADLVAGASAPATAVAGNQITFGATVQNLGPSDAANTQVAMTLPAGVTFISATGGGTHAAGVVTWNLGTLTQADGQQAFSATVAINTGATGTLTPVVTVSSSTPDPVPGNDTDNSASTNVTTSADLVVGASAPATATAGTQITFTATVQNSGPSDAADTQVTMALPTGVTFVSATGGGTHAGGVVTWNLGALAPADGLQTLGAEVTIDTGTTGIITQTVAANSTTSDPNAANNTDSASTNVTASADLVAGAAAPATADPGTQITFGATVQNNGPSDAQGTQLTMTLPAGVTFVQATGGGTHASGVVTWDLGTLSPAAGQQAFSVDVNVDIAVAGTSIEQSVAVTASTDDPTPGNNTATASTAVNEAADLVLTKTVVTAGPFVVGDNLTYRITAENQGPAITNPGDVTDPLPPEMTYVSSTAGSYNAATHTVTWGVVAGQLLPTDGPQVMDIVVQTTAVGTFQNTATFAPGNKFDPDLSNNSDPAPVTASPLADLVAGASAPATATAGTEVTFTATVQNNGPDDAPNTQVAMALPGNVTFVSATGGITPVGNTLTWSAGTLTQAAGLQSFDAVVTIDAGFTGDLTPQVTVSSSAVDRGPGLNNASATTTVVASADLVAGATAPATATAGTQITFTATVQNNGPSDAAGTQVVMALPSTGVTFVSATGGITPAGNTLTWNVGTLTQAAGLQSFDAVVNIDVGFTGALTPQVTVSSTAADPGPGQNNASATTTVGVPAPLNTAATSEGSPRPFPSQLRTH
jgi:uncharacterized repeat protein (TIGR01451 family)